MVKRRPVKSRKPDTSEPDEPPEPWGTTPPQSGLVPFGNTPFYHTPDEPADPRDCNRYPSSIYCGENPWTTTPVALEPAIVIDSCNLGIELTPILGFTTLPPVQIVYRRNIEECREPPPKTPEPPEPPVFDGGNGNYIHRCENFAYVAKMRNYLGRGDLFFYRTVAEQITWANQLSPIQMYEHLYERCGTDCTLVQTFTGNGDYAEQIYFIRVGNTEDINIQDQDRNSVAFETLGIIHRIGYVFQAYRGNGEIFNPADGSGTYQYGVITGISYDTSIIPLCPPPTPPPPILAPPPPRPPKKCDCKMTCCPDITQNDDLLKSLIKKVDKLSKIVGVDDYPVSLPNSLISKDEGFLGNLIPNFNEDVPSLTRFLAWYVERFDEIMGQWEIPIEVKDSDPTKPGDQPVGFKLPNMAEAIGEMFGLLLQTSINSETLVNMNTRALLEGGQVKQQTFKSYMMIQAIADYLGFEYKEVINKLPMLFKINETELEKMLAESELEVSAPEYTGTSTFKNSLNELLQAAAIIRAVHYRKFDPKGDVKQQFKDLISKLVTSGDQINNQGKDDNDKDDFDRFLEDVEVGFTQKPGITDSTHPYGRDYNQRPRIKELGDTSDLNNGT